VSEAKFSNYFNYSNKPQDFHPSKVVFGGVIRGRRSDTPVALKAKYLAEDYRQGIFVQNWRFEIIVS
jgi:hypothetical protein